MRKPEKSLKRRRAALNRAKNRARRNTKEFRKKIGGRREHIRRMKEAEKRKFDMHLDGLLGR